MTLKNSLKTALHGLLSHKSRSALTILGIVIGITAIILVMSLGQGAQDLILAQIQGLGSKTVVVIPGREPSGPSDFAQVFSDSLRPKDLEAIAKKANVPTLQRVMPLVFGAEKGTAHAESYHLTIFGTSELATRIFDIHPDVGDFFSAEDVKSQAPVVVIGSKVKDKLFGGSSALGEKIKLKDRNFRVVGILPPKGQVSFFNFDEAALVPYTTAQAYIFGIKYFHRFIVEAATDAAVAQTARDLTLTIRAAHGITDPVKDDFFVQTQADLAARVGTITNVLTLFLAAMAAISLVVGGIGIMNIMLVSVVERTREIGLRKAVGATNRDILTQFLLEAVSLTFAGGVIGVALGSGLSFLVSVVLSRFASLSWTFTFPLAAAALGLGVAALVGLVFGLYPARRAATLDPIEALRYE